MLRKKKPERRPDEKPAVIGKKTRYLKSVLLVIRDIAIAALIMFLILVGFYIYSGIWPPLVVIESQSMSHGTDSAIGVIDSGDIVIVKSVSNKTDIVTYVEGKARSHIEYGDYGDVIVYRKYGSEKYTPVIHRAIVWLEFNTTTNKSYDVPEMNIYNSAGVFYIEHYGHKNVTVKIDLGEIIAQFRGVRKQPHSGYITMGDYNAPAYDQSGFKRICAEPIKFDWIIGKARGEIPWFGALKLLFSGKSGAVPQNSWLLLGVCITLIVVLPISVDYAIHYILKRKKEKKNTKGTKEIESKLESEVPPK